MARPKKKATNIPAPPSGATPAVPGAIRDRVKELRRVRAGDLLPNPANWRLHPDSQREVMRGLLSEVGYADALIAYETPEGLRLIDGHLRAETTPDEIVPVLVLDVDEAEALKLLATLDPVAAMAKAGTAQLDALLRSVSTSSEAVAKMLADLGQASGCEWGRNGEIVQDEVPGPPKVPITKPGDLWLLGEHRLLCGDSTKAEDVGRLMGDDLAELLVTSPPYNQGIDKFKPSGMHKEGDWVAKVGRLAYADSMPEPEYQAQQKAALDVWDRALGDGASLFYNHKNRYRDKRIVSPLEWLPGPFSIRQEIIWSRPGSVTQNARMFLPSDERIYWMYKGTGFYFDDSTEVKSWSTVWKIGLETNKTHAVAFPVELPARCMKACSRAFGIVFEPHSGSGTTIIAAEQLSRRCFAIELEPAYCDVACQRWAKLTGKTPVLAR